MTLITRLLNSTSPYEHNYVSPYIGMRDVCLSEDIQDVYYLEKSHKYLYVYKNYISLSKADWLYPHEYNPNVLWIKSVEGVKKVIPLSLRSIICVYKDYISILDGVKCTEQIVCSGIPVTSAFVYEERDSLKHIKLGVISSLCGSNNHFESYKIPRVQNRRYVEVKQSVSNYFFNLLSNNQISQILLALPEPVTYIEILDSITCLFTPNFMWLVGSVTKLSGYKYTYTKFITIDNVVVVFKLLD